MDTTRAGPIILNLDSPHEVLALVGSKGASLARLSATVVLDCRKPFYALRSVHLPSLLRNV